MLKKGVWIKRLLVLLLDNKFYFTMIILLDCPFFMSCKFKDMIAGCITLVVTCNLYHESTTRTHCFKLVVGTLAGTGEDGWDGWDGKDSREIRMTRCFPSQLDNKCNSLG